MTSADSVFREAAAERRVESVPLSHLSIELGHLYKDDFAAGIDLQQHFAQIVPWVDAARRTCAEDLRSRNGKYAQQNREPRTRISTCFLVDDYFTKFSSPAEILPRLVSAARATGLEIDYLARESGCAQAEDVDLASLVVGHLVPDPPPSTNGSHRLDPAEGGWLCNGQRSPADDREAMELVEAWTPPMENSARRHSVFVDVQLWDYINGRRRWSCAFLAAVWQLLRLGMLRHNGEGVALPRPWKGELPDEWDKIPAVTKLNSTAAPFSAYRTVSMLSARFLPTELAGVRTILSQVAVDHEVLSQVTVRSQGEGVELPQELVDRIGYVIASCSAARPN